MVDEMQVVIESLLSAGPSDSSSDTIALVLLGVVVLFFAWLVVAVIRKLTGKSKMADFQEDEAEAQRTARLWAEAKRRAEDEEEEEEQDEADLAEEPAVDLQSELLQKAQERRESQTEDRALREARQKAFREIAIEEEPTQATQPIGAKHSEAEEPAQAHAPRQETPQQAEQPIAETAQTTPTNIVAPEPAPVETVPEPEKPRAVKSLEEGLTKTRAGFISKLTGMFGRPTLDEDELEEIEEILFTADIGVRTAQKLVDFIQNEVSRKDKSDPAKLVGSLRDKIRSMLAVEVSHIDLANHKPYVILVVGVNGTGKTTTIGKLAMRHTNQGRKVILAAADTFRAAASEQLEIWGQRTDAQVIRGQEGGIRVRLCLMRSTRVKVNPLILLSPTQQDVCIQRSIWSKSCGRSNASAVKLCPVHLMKSGWSWMRQPDKMRLAKLNSSTKP